MPSLSLPHGFAWIAIPSHQYSVMTTCQQTGFEMFDVQVDVGRSLCIMPLIDESPFRAFSCHYSLLVRIPCCGIWLVSSEEKREALVLIAAQAPITEIFPLWWKMIWEQGVTTVFMLTKLEEKGRVKAEQYWPLQIGPLADKHRRMLIHARMHIQTHTLALSPLSNTYTKVTLPAGMLFVRQLTVSSVPWHQSVVWVVHKVNPLSTRRSP
jgi:hypothetical protein